MDPNGNEPKHLSLISFDGNIYVLIVEIVKVFFGLALAQVFNVDEKSQVITLKVWEHLVSNKPHSL